MGINGEIWIIVWILDNIRELIFIFLGFYNITVYRSISLSGDDEKQLRGVMTGCVQPSSESVKNMCESGDKVNTAKC